MLCIYYLHHEKVAKNTSNAPARPLTGVTFFTARRIWIARPCCRKMAGWMSRHAGIVPKRLNISSNFFSRPCNSSTTMVFYIVPHYCCEILTGRGACHSGGLLEQWQSWTTFRPADTFTPSAYDTAVRRPTSCRYFSSLLRRAGSQHQSSFLNYHLTS